MYITSYIPRIPKKMAGFTRAAAPVGVSGLTRKDDYAQDSYENGRAPIKLPNGMVAIPAWHIVREDELRLNAVQRSRGALLNANWTPKMIAKTQYPLAEQLQRSPFIWADNYTFFYTRGMEEPHLLLGEWKKNAPIYGKPQEIHGVVVGGGGHYESVGNKPKNVEQGDFSLREAADKEIFEEMKIPRERVRLTQYLGDIDNFENDPRCHGVRHIFLRWIEISPSATDELKSVISIPLSMLNDLCTGAVTYTNAQGQKLSLVLNHDFMIPVVMAHPVVQEFIQKIKTTSNSPVSGSGGAMVFT